MTPRLPSDKQKEIQELEQLARRLSDITLPSLDKATKRRIAENIGIRRRWIIYSHPRLSFAGGAFAIFLAIILVSQSARPGTPLYAIKRGSQEVRLVVQPGFKQQLEKERAEEEIERQSDDSRRADESNDSSRRDSIDKNDDDHQTQNQDDSKKGSSRSGSSDDKPKTDSSGSSGTNKDKTAEDKSSGSGSSNGTSGGSGGHGSDDKTD